MQTTPINPAAQLKKIRVARKQTQNTVANGIGIKRGAYQAYEEGRAHPPLPVLFKLSEWYGLNSLDQLLGLTPVAVSPGDELYHAYQAAKPASRQIVDIALNYNC
jgi:transcriptional regulator with XRE-family HTH domain